MKITTIQGEPCRYLCQSEFSDTPHLVDLFEHACGCASFTMNNRRYKQQHGHNFTCKHITACREHFLDDVLEAMREQMLSR